jgi:hypothetical protein
LSGAGLKEAISDVILNKLAVESFLGRVAKARGSKDGAGAGSEHRFRDNSFLHDRPLLSGKSGATSTKRAGPSDQIVELGDPDMFLVGQDLRASARLDRPGSRLRRCLSAVRTDRTR